MEKSSRIIEDTIADAKMFLEEYRSELTVSRTSLVLDTSLGISQLELYFQRDFAKAYIETILKSSPENLIRVYSVASKTTSCNKEFTSDSGELQKCLYDVEGTNNKLNLEECFGIIKENIVSSSDGRYQDYLIFLSNGNFRLTQKVVSSLGLMEIKVFIFVFGEEKVNVNLDDIREIGGFRRGQVYHIKRQQDINSFFGYAQSILSGVTPLVLGTDYIRFAFPSSTNPPYKIRYRQVNDETEEQKMLEKKEDHFREVTIRGLKAECEYFFQFNISGSPVWSDPIKLKTIQEREWVKTLRDEKAAQQEVEKMINFFKSSEFDDSEFGKLMELYGLDRMNLLFLGRIGAGKSNFISTLASIFKGKLDRTKAHYANSNKSVTQEYKRITINEISDKICFMDIFGINENYDELIDPLLQGKIPEGFSETEIKKDGHISEEVLQEQTLDSQIHAVLIIFEPGTLMSEEEITKLKKIFEKIRDIPKFLILTKVDTLIAKDKESLKSKDLMTHPNIIFAMQEIEEKFEGFFRNEEIYPFMNYIAQFDKRDYPREYVALRILKDAIEHGLDYITQKNKLIEIYNRDDPQNPIDTIVLTDLTDMKLCDFRLKLEEKLSKKFNFIRKNGVELFDKDEKTVKMSAIEFKSPRDNRVRAIKIRELSKIDL